MRLDGGRMILLSKFEPERVVRLMRRATLLMGVPTFYTRLLAGPALTGQRILERYGMTETGMNASNPLVGERRAGTVGPALPGIELRVAGYWRLPEKTAEEMRPDRFFVIGDMARIEADGYVTIVGRAKDLIIAGG